MVCPTPPCDVYTCCVVIALRSYPIQQHKAPYLKPGIFLLPSQENYVWEKEGYNKRIEKMGSNKEKGKNTLRASRKWIFKGGGITTRLETKFCCLSVPLDLHPLGQHRGKSWSCFSFWEHLSLSHPDPPNSCGFSSVSLCFELLPHSWHIWQIKLCT